MKDLAHGLSDVAAAFEVLRQGGEVAWDVAEVGGQIKDAGGVGAPAGQEGCATGGAHRLLQDHDRQDKYSIQVG